MSHKESRIQLHNKPTSLTLTYDLGYKLNDKENHGVIK